ncbi:MAG: WD40 repeat domain-containing protein, partial [Kofleriaceae bacterium]
AGRRFAVASGREVVVFDIATRRELLRGEVGAEISALGWSPDGQRLATATVASGVEVWAVPHGN